MQIELIDDPDLIRRMGYPQDQARTRDVVHLSEIIKIIMRRVQPKRFGSGPFQMSPRVEAGILFESVLEQALGAKYSTVRPGEIVSPEGIFMSPDGVNPSEMAGEEYKATWMTCRHGIIDEYGMPLNKFVHWFCQMKGYAKWLDVRDFVLRVFYANGNYNRSGKLKDGREDPDAGPCFKSYKVRFSDQEIDENWQMIVNVAREEGLL